MLGGLNAARKTAAAAGVPQNVVDYVEHSMEAVKQHFDKSYVSMQGLCTFAASVGGAGILLNQWLTHGQIDTLRGEVMGQLNKNEAKMDALGAQISQLRNEIKAGNLELLQQIQKVGLQRAAGS
jgi:DNA segregation ATPase FtsK/SpoIIIE-like protein